MASSTNYKIDDFVAIAVCSNQSKYNLSVKVMPLLELFTSIGFPSDIQELLAEACVLNAPERIETERRTNF